MLSQAAAGGTTSGLAAGTGGAGKAVFTVSGLSSVSAARAGERPGPPWRPEELAPDAGLFEAAPGT
eukprot:966176-Prorocentrum_lima.AAC.1